ncbi:MAG: hypothetical protein KBT03_13665 [Bacteroidales bacterium]|nr:hypothetical protein [Candidatus Scybalousia scybalohippi]
MIVDDTSEEYYQALCINDRIEELRVEQKVIYYHLPIDNANIRINCGGILRLDILHRLAKFFNVSLEYLLYGGKKEPYKEIDINLKNIVKYFKENKIKHDSNSIKVTISKIKNNKSRYISPLMLFKLEKCCKHKLYDIITGEN